MIMDQPPSDIPADVSLTEALAFYSNCEYDQALLAFGRVIESASDKAQLTRAYCCRGDIHHTLGALEHARLDFTAALSIDPREAAARRGLAYLAVAEGRFSDALVELDIALAEHPFDLRLHIDRAHVLTWCNDYDSALTTYDRVLESPSAPRAEVLQSRSAVLKQLSRDADAVIDVSEAIDLYSRAGASPATIASCLTDRASLLIRLNDYSAAIDDYSTLINNHKVTASTYLLRAFAYEVVGQYQHAIDDLEVFLERQPDRTDIRELRDNLQASLDCSDTS
jgi:tetratricopeptide (TPR) repeat protein